jgi:hypothetical protein
MTNVVAALLIIVEIVVWGFILHAWIDYRRSTK